MSVNSARPANLEHYVTAARQIQGPTKDAAAAALDWYHFTGPKPWSLYAFSDMVTRMTLLENGVEVVCRLVVAADGPVADSVIQQAFLDAGIPSRVCTAFGPPAGYNFAEAIQAFNLVTEFIREGKSRNAVLDCLEDLDPEERDYVFEQLSDEHRIWLLNDVRDNWSFDQRRRFYDLLLSTDCMFETCFQHISPEDLEALYNIPPSLWEWITTFAVGVPIGFAKGIWSLITTIPDLVESAPEIYDQLKEIVSNPGQSWDSVVDGISYVVENRDELIDEFQQYIAENPGEAGEALGGLIFEALFIFLTSGVGATFVGPKYLAKAAQIARRAAKALDSLPSSLVKVSKRFGRTVELGDDPHGIRRNKHGIPMFYHPETGDEIWPTDLTETKYKGSFGEYVITHRLKQEGLEPLLPEVVLGTNDSDVLSKGIDQIFRKPNGDLVVVEVKFRSDATDSLSLLGRTKGHGRQMSHQWILGHAENLLDSGVITQDEFGRIKRRDYERQLHTVNGMGIDNRHEIPPDWDQGN